MTKTGARQGLEGFMEGLLAGLLKPDDEQAMNIAEAIRWRIDRLVEETRAEAREASIPDNELAKWVRVAFLDQVFPVRNVRYTVERIGEDAIQVISPEGR